MREDYAPGSIAGIVAAVPSQRITNSDCADPQTAEEAAKITGVRERRWVRNGQSAYDLNLAAARELMQRMGWAGADLDVIVYVTQTPSRAVPADVYSLAAELGATCPCIQTNYSCAGYVYGLWLAMKTMPEFGKALLIAGDATSTICDPSDRATAPLFGDAGSATAIEGRYELCGVQQTFFMGTDGAGVERLRTKRDYICTFRSKGAQDHLTMDGAAVFSFTLKRVPEMVRALKPDPDYWLMHNANRFMLDHLAKKCGLPPERVPINIERFGNTSCASIPLLICDPQAGVKFREDGRVAMLGYGAGWAWAGASIRTHALKVQEMIEV